MQNIKLYTIWEGTKESGKWSVIDEGVLCWHSRAGATDHFMGPEGRQASRRPGRSAGRGYHVMLAEAERLTGPHSAHPALPSR